MQTTTMTPLTQSPEPSVQMFLHQRLIGDARALTLRPVVAGFIDTICDQFRRQLRYSNSSFGTCSEDDMKARVSPRYLRYILCSGTLDERVHLIERLGAIFDAAEALDRDSDNRIVTFRSSNGFDDDCLYLFDVADSFCTQCVGSDGKTTRLEDDAFSCVYLLAYTNVIATRALSASNPYALFGTATGDTVMRVRDRQFRRANIKEMVREAHEAAIEFFCPDHYAFHETAYAPFVVGLMLAMQEYTRHIYLFLHDMKRASVWSERFPATMTPEQMRDTVEWIIEMEATHETQCIAIAQRVAAHTYRA